MMQQLNDFAVERSGKGGFHQTEVSGTQRGSNSSYFFLYHLFVTIRIIIHIPNHHFPLTEE